MTATAIRQTRAETEHEPLSDEQIALIKGMLIRGDKQSDIAACFLENGGRISEINTGARGQNVGPAPAEDLPPPGPYPSFYELWQSKKDIWRTRVTLERANELLLEAIAVVRKAEQR